MLAQENSGKRRDGPLARRLSAAVLLLPLLLSGCGAISATTLRCGTDQETSYVEVVSAPQSLSQNTRALGELCAFAYDKQAAE